MLIDHKDYEKEMPDEMYSADGAIFIYCSFKNMILNGRGVDSVIISCKFVNFDWYWGFFNGCLAVDTTFSNCVFRGVGFSSCRFLNCKFNECRFENDNLGHPCDFDDTKWFDSEIIRSTGLPFPLP
jgi:uncharacterized protein YjbI with pentapeptide repeats